MGSGQGSISSLEDFGGCGFFEAVAGLVDELIEGGGAQVEAFGFGFADAVVFAEGELGEAFEGLIVGVVGGLE